MRSNAKFKKNESKNKNGKENNDKNKTILKEASYSCNFGFFC